jgi:ATP-binding cassette subfamily B protein
MATLGILNSVFVQKLIDDLLPNELWDKTTETLTLLGLLLLLRLLLGILRGKLLAFFQESFSKEITHHYYTRLLKIPSIFFTSRKTGEIISRINDLNRIQRNVSSVLGSLSVDFVVVLVCTIYLYFLSDKLMLIVLGSLVGYIIKSTFFDKGLKKGNRAVMHSYAISENIFISVFIGI